ncbi:MAG: calcium-binding protein [Methylococcaceae bacterium]|nr:MAG: calcium-binding protein [Methylococcaceae bacterium]
MATPEILISKASGNNTGENGDKVVFNVELSTQPLRDVSMTFTSSDTSEGAISNATLVFNAGNWNDAQTFTVRGIDDYLDDKSVAYSITTAVSTMDVNYARVTHLPIDLTNMDDGRDTPLQLYGDADGPTNDILQGKDGPDRLQGKDLMDDISGGLGNDRLYGGYDNDFLYGQAGNDYLNGEQDDDYLEGGDGQDSLDGGEGLGADTLIGGAGNDIYFLGGYDLTPDTIQDKGATSDVDTVIMPFSMDRYTLPANIENGTISQGTDDSDLAGNGGNNRLTGNDGDNGLNGGNGRDSIAAGVGNDVVQGGTGNDTLSGGAGRDSFVFNAELTANVDQITDFNSANDTIRLENSVFVDLSVTGTLSTNAYTEGAAARDSSDRIIYNDNTGAVLYDGDGAGGQAAVQVATIGVNLSVTASDFVVI